MIETGLMIEEQFADFEVIEPEPDFCGECAVDRPSGVVFDLETACMEAMGRIDRRVDLARVEIQGQTEQTLADIAAGQVGITEGSVSPSDRMAWMANTIPFALYNNGDPGRRVLAEDLAA